MAISLEIDFLRNTRFPKQMVTSARSKLESKMKEQVAQILKCNVGITSAVENLRQQFFPSAHDYSLPQVSQISKLSTIPNPGGNGINRS